MQHYWVGTNEGWKCAFCKEKVEYKFEFPTPPEGSEWIKRFVTIEESRGTIPYMELKAGDAVFFAYPTQFPLISECKNLQPIDRLMNAILCFPRDYGHYISTPDTWEQVQRAIPELLSLAIDADAILENGLQAKIKKLSALQALK